jgi:septum formation protein
MEDKRNNQASALETSDLRAGLSDRPRIIELPKIILASGSPRRAEILRTVGWPFEIMVPDIDETRRTNEDAVTYVQRLARSKAEAVAQRAPSSPIVAADTTVVIDEQILEKPSDQNDAGRMLRKLSGQWHQVITGVALIDGSTSQIQVRCEKTEVKFAAMSQDEIDWYALSGEPMDKAGAYAIQGLGARFIERIRGDYFNVMGLPLRLLYEMVREFSAKPEPNGARTSLSA